MSSYYEEEPEATDDQYINQDNNTFITGTDHQQQDDDQAAYGNYDEDDEPLVNSGHRDSDGQPSTSAGSLPPIHHTPRVPDATKNNSDPYSPSKALFSGTRTMGATTHFGSTMGGTMGAASPMEENKARLKAIELEIARMKAHSDKDMLSKRVKKESFKTLEKGWNGGIGTFKPSANKTLSSGGFRPEDLALTLGPDGPYSARTMGNRSMWKTDLLGGNDGYNLIEKRNLKYKSTRSKGDNAASSPKQLSKDELEAERRAERIRKEKERQERLWAEIEEEKRAKNESATKIQCMWRGRQAKAKARYLREERDYGNQAVLIQNQWRMKMAKSELDRRRRERDEAIAREKADLANLIAKIEASEEDDYNFTDDELLIIRAQFDRVDTDSSGDVSREEFSTFYNMVAMNKMTVEECNELFDELDTDGSGQLGFDEFVQLYALLCKRDAAKRDPLKKGKLLQIESCLKERAALLAKWRAEDRERKALYQKQKDAEIARLRAMFGNAKVDELKRTQAREEFFKRRREEARRQQEEDEKLIQEARHAKEVEMFLAKARARIERQNKKATADTMAASVLASSPRGGGVNNSFATADDEEEEFTAEELAVLRRQFNFFDIDGNGDISRDEFLVFYNSIAVKTLSRGECDDLFRQLDADNSGALSFEQFAQSYNLIQQLDAAKRDPRGGARAKALQEHLARKAREVKKVKKHKDDMRKEYKRRQEMINRENKAKHDEISAEESQRVEAARQELIRRRAEEARRRREENELLVAAAREQEEVSLFLKKAAYRLKHNLQGEPYSADELRTLKSQFDRFDVDGSGDIGIDEWEVFYNSIALVQVSQRESEQIFYELDADNSGGLHFDQFVNCYDLLQLRDAAKRDPLSAKRYQELGGKVVTLNGAGTSTPLEASLASPRPPATASSQRSNGSDSMIKTPSSPKRAKPKNARPQPKGQ